MNRLKTIWRILTTKDWILIGYKAYNTRAYPFELYLPQGYVAHYYDDEVIIRRLPS